MRGLQDKNAFVTGAGGAIGSAIAARLAAEGARVGVIDLNASTANEVAGQIEKDGGTAHAIAIDATDPTAVSAAVDEFEEKLGRIDVLVNGVGWDKPYKFIETEPDFWQKLVQINLITVLATCHTVGRRFAEREHAGKIINIASDAGRVGSSGEAVYSACKGGVISFTKSLARELARYGVCVNAVAPGPTQTPLLESFKDGGYGERLFGSLSKMIPFRRLADPADIEGIVAFLASSDASYITGQVISVSGGLTMHG